MGYGSIQQPPDLPPPVLSWGVFAAINADLLHFVFCMCGYDTIQKRWFGALNLYTSNFSTQSFSLRRKPK